MEHWKEILPANYYRAYINRKLHPEDIEVLTLLYQPLVGSIAYSLYMTLMTDVTKQSSLAVDRSHKTLMFFTGQNLNILFEERKKLEALGLLRVYQEKLDGEWLLYYHLIAPKTPAAFFADELYPVFLYNKLGNKEHYRELLEYFRTEPPDISGANEITKGIDEVFQSLQPSEMKRSTSDMLSSEVASVHLPDKEQESSYTFKDQSSFNIEKMTAFLPSFIDREALEQPDSQRLIEKLAFLYKLSNEEMAQVIQDSMLHSSSFSADELKKQAKRRYLMHEGEKPPRLGLRTQPEEFRTVTAPPQTKEEKHIQYLETTSPIEFLEDMQQGGKVYEGEMAFVEQLIFDYGLNPGVVNALLDYIFMVNDMKLSKPMASTIAGHWKRKKVATVKDAMDLARQEYEKRQEYKQKTSQSSKQTGGKSYRKQTPVKEEPLPKWMTDDSWKQADESEEDMDKAKQKAAEYRELLKKRKQQRKEES